MQPAPLCDLPASDRPSLPVAAQFVQLKQPWVLRRHPDKQHELHSCLAVAMETLRVAGILLQPVVPSLAGRLLGGLPWQRPAGGASVRKLTDVECGPWTV